MEPIESREYSIEEVAEIAAGKQKTRFVFLCSLTMDDYFHEDTAMLKIAMPRGFWKVLLGAAKSSGHDADKVASELLGDKLWDLLEEARQLSSVSQN